MSNVLHKLCEAAWRGPAAYQSEYISSFSQIQGLVTAKASAVGNISGKEIPEIADLVKVSCLYNELSALRIRVSSNEMTLGWLADEAIKGDTDSGEIEITVPAGTPTKALEAMQAGNLGLSFVLPNSEEVQQFFSDAGRLIEAGRLLVEPDRLIFYHDGEKNENGGINWHGLSAEILGTNFKQWRAKSESEDGDRRLPTLSEQLLDEREGETSDILVTELSLPLLQGVSLADYALILNDEADIIEDFRREMRAFERQLASGEKSLAELRDDVLGPRIAKIDRSFKRISRMTSINTAGAIVATSALVVTAVATQGAAAAVAAAAGGAGFIKSLKEWTDGTGKLQELRDDPAYLLWKFKCSSSK